MDIINIILLNLLVIFVVYLFFVIAYLLLDNRDPQSTLSWILILLFLPIIGLIFYLFLGKNWRRVNKKINIERKMVESAIYPSIKEVVEGHYEELKKMKGINMHSQSYELISLLHNNGGSILSAHNHLKIFQEGKDKFNSLILDLKKAKKHIHMEYFIWRSDSLTEKIHKVLIKKAKEGVEIRIIIDFIGGMSLIKKDKKMLEQAGIKICFFSNKLQTLNYRNHRKLVVIDGLVSYIGGMNMGLEYIQGVNGKFNYWRDTHMRIQGELVVLIQSLFVHTWHHLTKERLFEKSYFPTPKRDGKKVLMQICTSGPDSKWDSIKQLYFSLINSSDAYIYLQTPYFAPDNSILMALKTAALRGLDVRLMLAKKSDNKVLLWAGRTFFKELLNAGVKIYYYEKGFLHSKTLILDDKISTIGTANFDNRSFNLNYELNALIFNKKVTLKLKEDFIQDLKDCKEVTIESLRRDTIFERIRNSIFRVFAPLL